MDRGTLEDRNSEPKGLLRWRKGVGGCRWRVPVAVAGMLFALGAGASAEVLYVGPGVDCDHATIDLAIVAAAVNGPEDDVLVLIDSELTEPDFTDVTLDLLNWNSTTSGELTLEGGVTECGGARGVSSGVTRITNLGGGGALPVQPVIQVRSTSTAGSRVVLRQLDIVGALPTQLDGPRGLVVSGAGAVAELDGSDLFHHAGGGVAVSGGAHLLVDLDSALAGNSALGPGGGLSCTGSGSTVALHGDLLNNDSGSSGGGGYIDGGCVVRFGGDSYVAGNQARWGGGFEVSGSGSLLERDPASLPQFPFTVDLNAAQEDGGGLSVVNGAIAFLNDAAVINNSARERGAGLFTGGGALVTMDQTISDCERFSRCPRLAFNRILSADGNRLGSAVFAESGGDAILTQTFIDNNSAVDELGYTIWAEGAGSEIILESIVLSRNDTQALFVAQDGALVRAAFVSAAANTTSAGNPGGGVATTDGNVEVFSSVLWDIEAFFSSGAGEVSVDCVLAETLTGASATRSFDGPSFDPLFVSPTSGNLRLGVESPAIDYCDTSAYVPTQPDVVGATRGVDVNQPDNPFVPGPSPYDLGAFEMLWFFADGFESGSTMSWSSTVP